MMCCGSMSQAPLPRPVHRDSSFGDRSHRGLPTPVGAAFKPRNNICHPGDLI